MQVVLSELHGNQKLITYITNKKGYKYKCKDNHQIKKVESKKRKAQRTMKTNRKQLTKWQ